MARKTKRTKFATETLFEDVFSLLTVSVGGIEELHEPTESFGNLRGFSKSINQD